MNWLSLNWRQVLDLAGDHLALSIIPIVLGVLIAVPVGRLAFRFPKAGGVFLSVTTLLYAVPALPLLIVIPVIFGTPLRSSVTMIIALTIYAVALMVRTAADSFFAIDSTTYDSAVAVGHSPRSLFWKVELPLAIPILLSGARVISVSTIGLVTIGALIGVPSLGTLLTDGFQRGIPAEVLTGISATVILALAADGLLLLIGRMLVPWKYAKQPRRSAHMIREQVKNPEIVRGQVQ